MGFPTLLVEIAFTGDNPANYVWSDVSADVRSLTTSRGRQRQIEAFAAGTLTLELDDNAGNYDPDNAASIYATGATTNPVTSVLPMRPIRVTATWNSVTYPVYYGYIDSIAPQYAPGQYSDTWVVVTASDGMKILNNYLASGAVGNQLTGARVTSILDSVGWPATLRTIATGDVLLQATTLAATAAQELQTAIDSEYGRWYIGADGKLIFENRSSRSATQTPVATWRDTDSAGLVTTDSFDRADSTATLGSTDGGTVLAWTQRGLAPFGGGPTGWGIVSNQAYTPALPTYPRVPGATVNLASPDVDVSVTIATASNQAGIVFRLSDDNNFYTLLSWTSSPQIRLSKWVGGAETVLGTVGGTAYGAGDTMRVVLSGGSIVCYRNASIMLSASDTFNASATNHGIFTQREAGAGNGGDSGVRFNNFSAVAQGGLLYRATNRVVDDDLVRNAVTVTRQGGIAQSVTDAASVLKYGPRSYSVSSLGFTTDTDSQALADIILFFGRELAGCRFEGVTFEPVTSIAAGATGDLWPEMLGRLISQRVAITVTPPRVAPFTVGAFVEGVSHQITTSPRNWVTTFHVSRSALTNFLIFNDPVYGTIGTINAFGY